MCATHKPWVMAETRLESEFSDEKPLFTDAEALIEANRCLYCYDAPCVQACPTSVDIPAFIKKITSGNITGSARTILCANLLGSSTASVCPVEVSCVGACVYNDLNRNPVRIGRLQRYATEKALAAEARAGNKLLRPREDVGKRVALIGAGPASLACAAYLALAGVRTVIFEKSSLPGGLNTTGAAPYKLRAEASLAEVGWLLGHGVEINTGVEIGKAVPLEQLSEEYDAVFIGTGLGNDIHLGIPGENGPGVWGATALIREIKNRPGFKLPDNLHAAVVIGGGNTAIDIARELAMLGVDEVNIIYRRTEGEMPGYRHELEAARRHSVRLHERMKPVEIIRESGQVKGVKATSTVSGNTFEYACDWVVVAIGQTKQIAQLFPQIPVDEKGRVLVDAETRETSIRGVYAGGDCVNGGKEVVNAVADGREAAFAMLRGWNIEPEPDHGNRWARGTVRPERETGIG